MKLLLHSCCAPCLSGTQKALSGEDMDMTIFFFNPNIHPEQEFKKRIDALKNYTEQMALKPVIFGDYDMELFEREVMSKPGDRCRNCYELRLRETARYACMNGYDAFSTTILISPHQKHDLVKQLGEELAREYNTVFYYKDLRPYYKDSVSISKEMGIYRQKYCGCYISKEQRHEQAGIASK